MPGSLRRSSARRRKRCAAACGSTAPDQVAAAVGTLLPLLVAAVPITCVFPLLVWPASQPQVDYRALHLRRIVQGLGFRLFKTLGR